MHQEGQIELDPEEDGWESPPATVDERLLQARNFLSDEDPDSQRDFAKRLEAIGNYLRKLANEEVPCDIKVYKEVQDMLRVHQSRMNQQNGQILPPFEERLLPRQSVRLALFDMDRAQLRGAPLRDDHPPFTIKRPVDHDAFIEALRANTPRGQALRKIENDAYSQILNDPSLVREHMKKRTSRPRMKDLILGRRTEVVNVRLYKLHFALLLLITSNILKVAGSIGSCDCRLHLILSLRTR